MNFEDAANILDPETSLDALNKIKYYAGFRGEDAAQEAVIEACRIAADELRKSKLVCTQLTMDQLRQMKTPTPVWAKTQKKTIESWDGYWCICQRGHIITPGLVSMYADKMEGVTFYSCPPIHIDMAEWRSDWERIGAYVTCVSCGYVTNERGHFCAHCGKAMDEKACVELEKRMGARM